jgi:hypothetical protein
VRQWIGQLAEEPRLWFMVWAPDRRAARAVVSEDLGAIAPGSIREVKGAGYFLFEPALKRPQKAGPAQLEPSRVECLVLYDERAEAWVLGRAGSVAARLRGPARAAPRRRRSSRRRVSTAGG